MEQSLRQHYAVNGDLSGILKISERGFFYFWGCFCVYDIFSKPKKEECRN
jgi:hypothetical protein